MNTTPDHDAITAKLPAGYRAREFADSDRDPLVADRNAEVAPMQQRDAAEWREWERLEPPKDELRLTVTAPDGTVAAHAGIGPGHIARPDGTLHGGVGVVRAHRGKGIGDVLLAILETEALARKAPRILAGVDAATPQPLAWAGGRGYREIGRRIESYVEVPGFDPAPFAETVARLTASGLRLRTFAEALDGRDEESREAFWRALYEAEAPMWEDIPWASPRPHWPYEQFRRLAVESGKLIPEASLLVYDGETIAGFTTTGRQRDRGYTWMTGVGRAYRGRGIALALKVEMLKTAKAAGLTALLTTNDEPNKAMRGINAKLGYIMLPAHIELEKTL